MARVKKYYRISNDDYRFVSTVAGLMKMLPEDMVAQGAVAIANHFWQQLRAGMPVGGAGDGSAGSKQDSAGTVPGGVVAEVPGEAPVGAPG